ncbi:MAG: hypothetical protein GY867_05685 [bacterium]|nr:hypothetical protein [bacterium]
MRYEIRSIGIWAYLKIGFFLNLLIGFIGGLFFAVFMSFQMALMDNLGLDPGPGFGGEELPIGILMVIMPIMFAIGGAIFYTLFGLIFVFIYNLVAKLTGGFEMDLRAVDQPPPVQSVSPQPAAPQTAPPASPREAAPPWQPPPPPPGTPPPPITDEHRPPEPQGPLPPAGDEPR